MTGVAEYVEMSERTRETVMSYAQQQWPVVKSTDGIEFSVYQNTDVERPGKVFKAVGVIEAPPATTFDYILPGPLKLEWDTQVKSCEVLYEIQEDMMVLRTLSHGAVMGLISPREYIDLVTLNRDTEENVYFSYSTGIEYPYPEDPNYVRGINHPSAIMCFPLEGDPSRTRMVYMFQTDLKGMLPQRLIDSTLHSVQANFFKGLRKAIGANMKEKMCIL